MFYEDGAIRARDDLGYAPSCNDVVACGCCCHLFLMTMQILRWICQAAPRNIDRSLLLRRLRDRSQLEWTAQLSLHQGCLRYPRMHLAALVAKLSKGYKRLSALLEMQIGKQLVLEQVAQHHVLEEVRCRSLKSTS